MSISPAAGKPADPSFLVSVPKLITAYYELRPDASNPRQLVVFGTSGHRGSATDVAFNEWHILAITQAICDYRKLQNVDGPLFPGMDTHALSEPAFALRFGSATVQQQGEQYPFEMQVFLEDVNPDAVKVELYAEAEKDAAPIIQPTNRGERLAGAETGFTYTAFVPATRAAADYTPHLVPPHEGELVPLEASFILRHDAPSGDD